MHLEQRVLGSTCATHPFSCVLLQTSGASSGAGTVSVVKVINTSAAGASTTTTAASPGGVRLAKAQEPVRRVETLCKQEKANRIVAEAIARAKARGERNIPRVLNQDELPSGQAAADGDAGGPAAAGAKKKGGGGGGGGGKKKSPVAAAGGGKGGAAAGGGAGDKKAKAKVGGAVGVAGGTGGGSKSKGKSKPK